MSDQTPQKNLTAPPAVAACDPCANPPRHVSGLPTAPADAASGRGNLLYGAPDLLAVVRAVEWSAQVDMETGGTEPGCPMCGAARDIGHNLECKLAAALAKVTGQ